MSCSNPRRIPFVSSVASFLLLIAFGSTGPLYAVAQQPRAPDEATIREHARLGGFPATRVSVVSYIIDPTTAE